MHLVQKVKECHINFLVYLILCAGVFVKSSGSAGLEPVV